MKETGIVMTGDHPAKILDNLKTMTRRTWGLGYINKAPNLWICTGLSDEGVAYFDIKLGCEEESERIYGRCQNLQQVKCPYGHAGDNLWVKETWATEKRLDHLSGSELGNAAEVALWYKADSSQHSLLPRGRWRSSRFMPKWVSRIPLRITQIGIARLQLISDEDITAEGCQSAPGYTEGGSIGLASARQVFKWVWDSINAKRGYSYDFDPWVWPIKFEKQ